MDILLLACGALRRELEEVLGRHSWAVKVEYLSPDLHMAPDELARATESRLKEVRERYQRVILIYGQCAPGLDEIATRYEAERLPGEHCYEVFADGGFLTYLREAPGTYFLTDFLCRNFPKVIKGLGLDRYPSLKKTYFKNYTRVVFLDTGAPEEIREKAHEIASYLELPLLVAPVGVRGLERRLAGLMEATKDARPLTVVETSNLPQGPGMSEGGSGAIVTLDPGDIQVEVRPGESLLEAVRAHGLHVPTVCGGQGTCGKCRVLIQGPLDPPCEAERLHVSHEDLEKGVRLACRTRPLTGQVIRALRTDSGNTRILKGGRARKTALSPAVRKVLVRTDQIARAGSQSDWERVAGLLDGPPVQPALAVLRSLPDALRHSPAELTLAFHGDRLASVEAGNTTRRLFGMAFDIGTTTVVGYLMDLTNGRQVAAASALNPQRSYGEDLVSRLSFVQQRPDGLAILQRDIVSLLNNLIGEASQEAGVDRREIYDVTLVGNVVMHHLLLGIDPASLARAPYTPVVRDPLDVTASEIGLDLGPQAEAHVLPNVAGFVGGDLVGAMLTVLPHESEGIVLILDLGTNGEMAMGSRDRLLVCSTAAGPAFEGARIRYGMRAASGAIDRVRIDGDVHCHVMDGGPAAGICGSGLVDAVAQMVASGVVHPSGRLIAQDRLPRDTSLALRGRLRGANRAGDEPRFVLSPPGGCESGQEVAITQNDIRELQLAKGAICAGIQVLKKELGIEDSDIERVVLAGAFGSFINPASARAIGLIPPVPLRRVKAAGNAAGLGAQLALLSMEERRTAELIARRSEHIQLSGRADFQDLFLKALEFPGRK